MNDEELLRILLDKLTQMAYSNNPSAKAYLTRLIKILVFHMTITLPAAEAHDKAGCDLCVTLANLTEGPVKLDEGPARLNGARVRLEEVLYPPPEGTLVILSPMTMDGKNNIEALKEEYIGKRGYTDATERCMICNERIRSNLDYGGVAPGDDKVLRVYCKRPVCVRTITRMMGADRGGSVV